MISRIKGKKFKTRASAKQKGSSRYFTGNPCPVGHVADRMTSNGRCVECLYLINYSKKETDKRNERRRVRRKLDQELVIKERAESLVRYHQKVSTPEGKKEVRDKTNKYWHTKRKAQLSNKMLNDPEYAELVRKHQRSNTKKYRSNPDNKEKIKLSNKIRRQKNPARYRYYKAMRRARTYNATPPWLTSKQKSQIQALYEERQSLSEIEGIEFHVDHIIPLAFYTNVCGLHVPWNLQILSEEEHQIKTNREQSKKRKDSASNEIVAIYEDETNEN